MGKDGEPKAKKSVNTSFKQQRQCGTNFFLTADTILPATFIVAMVFIPAGIGLYFLSEGAIRDISVDYTDCFKRIGENSTTPKPETPRQKQNQPVKCTDIINKNDSKKTCECEHFYFTVKKNMDGQIMIFYKLTSFFQNVRRYLENRDYAQLRGDVGTPEHPKLEEYEYAKISEISKLARRGCLNPFRYPGEDKSKVYFPCGAVANSMFSDEISLFTEHGHEVPLLKKGIAFGNDKAYGFKNPWWFNEAAKNPNHSAWKVFVTPRSWGKKLWELDKEDPENNGLKNEDFIVWMRSAAFGNFKKLYRLVNHNVDCTKHTNTSRQPLAICDDKEFMQQFSRGLPKGQYYLKILYSYPVKSFGGTKSIVISSNTILGGKNVFLVYSHIGVGGCFFFMGILFIFLNCCYGKRNYLKLVGQAMEPQKEEMKEDTITSASPQHEREDDGGKSTLALDDDDDIDLGLSLGVKVPDLDIPKVDEKLSLPEKT